MDLNLSKAKADTLVSSILSKKGFKLNTTAKVCLVVDNSGSMEGLYRDGTVSSIVNRALSIGYRFDDDGDIDVFSFSFGEKGVNHHIPASQGDYSKYKLPYIGGGTSYEEVLRAVEKFYYKPSKASNFFSKLFGKKGVAEGRSSIEDKDPVFVIFITDGETLHTHSDLEAIKDICTTHSDMFISFVGLSQFHISAPFTTLKEAAKQNLNVSFTDANLSMNDQALFDGILSHKAINVLNKGK